jgi:hypothetical protein
MDVIQHINVANGINNKLLRLLLANDSKLNHTIFCKKNKEAGVVMATPQQ